MKVKYTSHLPSFLLIAITLLTAGCATNSQLIDGQDEIKKELAEIKKLIKERPAARKRKQVKAFEPSDISIANSPFLGKADAPVTIIEFTDYQCPFCKRFSKNTLPQIIKEYVDTGKVKYVLREFPLKSIHPSADKLAQAALCAGDQGKYWEMHDSYFTGATKPNPKDLSKEIAALKLNAKTFNACLDSDKYAKKVTTDISDGTKLGVRGTPSFFLGKPKKGDSSTVHATKMLRGAQGFPAFKKVIDELLK